MKDYTAQDIDRLARAVCWHDGGGIYCQLDCATCYAGHHKKWKRLVKIVLKELEKETEYVRNN